MNVKTLYQRGKLDNAIQEMASMQVDILGISEMRWKESGKFKPNRYAVVFSGHEKDHTKRCMSYSQRWYCEIVTGILATFRQKYFDQTGRKTLQYIYHSDWHPTQDHGVEKIKAFYEDIEEAIRIVKSDDVLIVMGDRNAKAEDEPIPWVMGIFGLSNQNERGQRMQQFCMENRLVIAHSSS